jgi:hypothetical protein
MPPATSATRLSFGGILLSAVLVFASSPAQAAPLVITCPPDVTVGTLQSKDPYATGTATTTGGVSPVTITYNDDRSGLSNCNATGTILRTWTATDAANDTSTGVQTITVVDNMPPQFTSFPTNITVPNDSNSPSAVVNYPAPIAEDLGYDQSFEDPAFVSGNYANNPSVDWNDYDSHLYRVPSGTDGIISPDGMAHAVIDSTATATDATGAFSRLGGYGRSFGTGFRVALDVYVDLNDPGVVNATTTNGYAWDLDAAASQQDGSFLRDFIFHTAAYGPTGIVVAADNNSSDDAAYRRNDLLTVPNHAVLTNSGWYTFEWIFRNNTNALAVDLNVRDTNGTLLFSQTLCDPSDLIDTIVGGNRYLWFNFLAVNKLAIDNAVLQRNVPVTCSIASGSAFPPGTNTVNCAATDACGNSTNASFMVIVSNGQSLPPAVPTLSIVPQGNGDVKIIASGGASGQKCVFQFSTDMVNWTTICTNTADSNGLAAMIDADAKKFPGRFYRAITP